MANIPVRELYKDWSLTVQENKLSGNRTFIDDVTRTTFLPTILDPFDNNNANLLLRTITTKKFAPDPADKTKWLNEYHCTYATGDNGSTKHYPDVSQRKFDAGGEISTMPQPDTTKAAANPLWKWTSDNKDIVSPQTLFIVSGLGTFTRSLKFSSTTDKNSWLTNQCFPKLGTLNSAAFENFAEGQVLFESISGGSVATPIGWTIWQFEATFKYRLIGTAGGQARILKDDWLYILRQDGSIWDKPQNKNNGLYLYTKSDFSQIFQGQIGG